MPAARVLPNFAAWLAANRDVTLTELAREWNVKISMLSMIKYGQRQPKLPLAIKMIDRCNIPLESLIKKSA